MFPCPRLLATAGFMVVLGEWAAGAPRGFPAKNEDELVARIQRERNPVKKAKYEMRLGRLKLLQAIDAYDKDNFEQCQTLLAAYLERMKSSWESLQSSGRQAVPHPQGFKELDIALREDQRLLEDLKHRVPYYERGVFEKAAREIEQIRNEVLRALFPAERPGAGRNKFGYLTGPRPWAGKVLA